MSELNQNERIALAKLAELSYLYLKIDDLNWLSKMFDIKKFKSVLPTRSHLYSLTKEDMFNYLGLVYTSYPDRFHKLMEEISRKILVEKLASLSRAAKMQKSIVSRKTISSNVVSTHYASLSKYLEVLGYKFRVDNAQSGVFDVQFVKREISEERREERTKLSNILEKHFKDEFIALSGAYERYLEGGTNSNRQAIDSCRNAYEHFFKKITKKGNWKEGLKDVIDSDSFVRLIKEVYNFLSGYGTHSNKEREQTDTLLAIRLTEDIMIRVLTEKGLW